VTVQTASTVSARLAPGTLAPMTPTRDDIAHAHARLKAAGEPASASAIATELDVPTEQVIPVLTDMYRDGTITGIVDDS
jgi:hypothetical protein